MRVLCTSSASACVAVATSRASLKVRFADALAVLVADLMSTSSCVDSETMVRMVKSCPSNAATVVLRASVLEAILLMADQVMVVPDAVQEEVQRERRGRSGARNVDGRILVVGLICGLLCVMVQSMKAGG